MPRAARSSGSTSGPTLLLGHLDDGRQPGVRRPQRRPLPGLQRDDRQARLVVPDGRRRERRRHDLPGPDGKEYIALLDFGNSLMATPHGDGVWLFGLERQARPDEARAAAAGTQHAARAAARAPRRAGNAAAGKAVFAEQLRGLPRRPGHGGNGGPDLTHAAARQDLGGHGQAGHERRRRMPAFKGSLTGEADQGRRGLRHQEHHARRTSSAPRGRDASRPGPSCARKAHACP